MLQLIVPADIHGSDRFDPAILRLRTAGHREPEALGGPRLGGDVLKRAAGTGQMAIKINELEPADRMPG